MGYRNHWAAMRGPHQEVALGCGNHVGYRHVGPGNPVGLIVGCRNHMSPPENQPGYRKARGICNHVGLRNACSEITWATENHVELPKSLREIAWAAAMSAGPRPGEIT